jgi:DNA helicase II / ATP-dependent DNA helicase PcrA
MQSSKNRIVIACAGSRKTTSIVEEALVAKGKVLITTYTNENVEQIISCIVKQRGYVPDNITVMSWYSFLLQEGVRPYQNHLVSRGRIGTISFIEPSIYTPKKKIDEYYLTRGGDIYSKRTSEFVCACDLASGGLVLGRLAKIYDKIFLDELQDFAGYDLEFFDRLFGSSIAVVAVGDPRQGTYSTNNSAKNKKFKRKGILEWVLERKLSGLVELEERNECYRSNQAICDFADAMFPGLPRTVSKNTETSQHDGIFYITADAVPEYFALHKPVVLRHDKRSDTLGLPASNIGVTKGKTFERVLIFPTGPMKKYFASKDVSEAGDLAKFYVAVTRARHSVAFVI